MKSQDRRAAIVASAIHLFADKGFRGTTTRELAAALSITEPVLYQHFRTKSDLYAAIIETKCRQGAVGAAELLDEIESDDRRFFTALANLILGHYREDPDFVRLLLYSALERHDLSNLFFEQHVLSFYDLVAGYIRRRVRAGAFRQVNPRLAARAFIGMVSYHGLVEVLYGNRIVKVSQSRLVQEMVTTFLTGIHRDGCSC
jgi:AcrR family transcriptional regulator